MGEFDEALSYAKQAHELNPNIAQVKDSYGYMLLKSGNSAEAATVLEQSYLLQNDNEIALHFVEALIANQQTEKAQQVLNNLQELNPEQLNKKAELEALLN
jgi:tetratricopeptide (TPR) repeat protein